MPNMRSLKVGDRVRCNTDSGCGGFRKGATYLISDLYDDERLVTQSDSDGLCNGWGIHHFELIEEAPPVAPEGPFYVIAVPGLTFATMEEAEEHAKGRAAKSSGTYAIFKGIKAFKLPTMAQEVPLAS